MRALTKLSLRRLPVCFRPYHDETLTSWLSRAAAVYGYTFRELISAYGIFRPEFFEDVDCQLNPLGSVFIQALVGGPMEQLQACTLAAAYPHWLPRWISRPAPLWHVTESRTMVIKAGLRPAVCSFCLIEDIENDRSQYMRLSWLSSITTICPIHRMPLIACCADCSPNSLAHGNDWSQNARMHCRGAGALSIALAVRRSSHNRSSLLLAWRVYCAPLWQAIESSTWEIGYLPAEA